MKKIITYTRLLFFAAILLASCGGSSTPETNSSETNSEKNNSTTKNSISQADEETNSSETNSEKNNSTTKNSIRQADESEGSNKVAVVGTWIKMNPKKKIFIDGKSIEYSFTFHSEDSASWKIDSENLLSEVTIKEERTGKIIQQKTNVKSMEFFKKIDHTDVYTIKVSSLQKIYFNLIIERMPMSEHSAKQSIDYICDTINSTKGTKNAIAIDEINFVKAVNEPRKIVLSSKVSLSGESKIILPLELPKNSTQLLYELRISGENEESSDDGQLFSKVSTPKFN